MEGCFLLGVQEVPSSNLASPAKTPHRVTDAQPPGGLRPGVHLESNSPPFAESDHKAPPRALSYILTNLTKARQTERQQTRRWRRPLPDHRSNEIPIGRLRYQLNHSSICKKRLTFPRQPSTFQAWPPNQFRNSKNIFLPLTPTNKRP